MNKEREIIVSADTGYDSANETPIITTYGHKRYSVRFYCSISDLVGNGDTIAMSSKQPTTDLYYKEIIGDSEVETEPYKLTNHKPEHIWSQRYKKIQIEILYVAGYTRILFILDHKLKI